MPNAYDLRLKNALLDAAVRRATGSTSAARTTAQGAASAPIPTATSNGNDPTRAYYFILSVSRLDRDHVLSD